MANLFKNTDESLSIFFSFVLLHSARVSVYLHIYVLVLDIVESPITHTSYVALNISYIFSFTKLVDREILFVEKSIDD